KCLIKIKDLVEIMTTIIIIDSNLLTRYDGRKLKSKNLTEEEWQAIGELIIILENFAKATEYLDGNKYTTISLMYTFDNNISYIDVSEEDDEPITGESKNRKITRIFQNNNNLKEVDNYLALSKIHFENCPLLWWKNN
ncbi:6772_t:CDS:2, partial [Diversispora eburnea]